MPSAASNIWTELVRLLRRKPTHHPLEPSPVAVRKPATNSITPPRHMPASTCTIELKTEFTQRVYQRTWTRLNIDLYVLTVRTRSNGMNDIAEANENVISQAFEHTRKDLESDLGRTESLIGQAKLPQLKYSDAIRVDVPYSTPRAKEFLDLLQKTDELLARYDALWMSGQIQTQQRIDRGQDWQQRLTRMTNRLWELTKRTRRELRERNDTNGGPPASK